MNLFIYELLVEIIVLLADERFRHLWKPLAGLAYSILAIANFTSANKIHKLVSGFMRYFVG